MIVLVKGDVHIYPERNRLLDEIHDANQSDLAFDVFFSCWLVLGAELSLKITDLQLRLKRPNGSTAVGKRVTGDLKSWQLVHVDRGDAGGSDWKRTNIQTETSFAELDTSTPLDCGVPRQGWVHFRMENMTPAELNSAPLELSVWDSLSHEHTAVVNNVRHLPGKISPV